MTEGGAELSLLDREARSLVQRLRLWTPSRWAAAAPAGAAAAGTSRAALAHHLVQALADLTLVEPVSVPRLPSDLFLPDQLAVVAYDLVLSAPPAGTAREATAHLLLHRTDLLGDEVPEGLRTTLGTTLETVRSTCTLT